jgi:hypothetical protein
MPRVGFEPTMPVFERAKAVHALDRAVTVISRMKYAVQNFGYVSRVNLQDYKADVSE